MSHDDDADFWSTRPAEGFSVCNRCIDDIDIRDFITDTADSQQCDFCGRKSRTKPIAARLDEVVEFMFQSIDREYDRAVNCLGWEGAEGGYQGKHFDSYDLIADEIGLYLPNDRDGRLRDILVDCLGGELWCERNPYGLRRDQELMVSWNHFCDFIKHERRYFFLQEQAKDRYEYFTPLQMLDVVKDAALEYDLVSELPVGSLIYRARANRPGEVLASPYDFGPPPIENAIQSNRMSPAGIVMFYGSEDPKTAVAEIDDDPQLGIVVGTFRTTRKVTILDLTALPRPLRFFELQSDSSSIDRYVLQFLHSFVESLAAKVERNEREHIEYVPTQVVTEYFRTVFRQHDGSRIDGVGYFSAQGSGRKSVVLFAGRDDLVLKASQIARLVKSGAYPEWELKFRHENAWLELVRKRVIRLPVQLDSRPNLMA